MYKKNVVHCYTENAQGYDSAVLLDVIATRVCKYMDMKIYSSYNVVSEDLDSQTQFQDNMERISWNMQNVKNVGVQP